MADELKGKTILLVDDDRDILLSMKTALAETGADIKTVEDGESAVREVLKSPPDLMVLDVMLPKRSGFLVLEKIRQKIKQGEPPRVIMVTGNPGTRHRVFAETLGVDIYLNKPFRIEKLVQGVKDLLTTEG